MSSLSFRVVGSPVAKGSTRSFIVKGRPVTTSTAKGLGAWAQSVAAAALAAMDADPTWERDTPAPVYVSLHFYLKKPKSAPKRRRILPTKKPDLDKCVRAVWDALTAAGVWHDDSQVISSFEEKHYAEDGNAEGVRVEVESWAPFQRLPWVIRDEGLQNGPAGRDGLL